MEVGERGEIHKWSDKVSLNTKVCEVGRKYANVGPYIMTFVGLYIVSL